MNCPNCTCPDCEKDRVRTDLKSHRLKVIESWNWNANAHEAGRSLSREIKAGRGGDTEDWHRDIRAFFSHREAESLIQAST